MRMWLFVLLTAGRALSQNASSGPVTIASGVQKALPSVLSVETVSGGALDAWTRVGSGFLFGDRYAVTRKSVIEGADSIVIALTDGRRAPARLVACDPATGTAVLEHGVTGIIPIPPQEFREPAEGDALAVLGNSIGVFPSVTLARFISRRPDGFMEIDGMIPPGNSGSPVLDETGRLTAVIIGRVQDGAGPQAVTGLALPASDVLRFLSALREQREKAGWIGLSAVDLTGKDHRTGVKVVSLLPGGPADLAELSIGDTIVRFQNEPVRGASDLAERVRCTAPDTRITFTVRNRGMETVRKVKVSAMPRRSP
ncbi:serine protease [bacterium]|nr:serine protease [bacterium]